MSREIEGKWGQEDVYARFNRVEVMRHSDEKNAKRLSNWYWRMSHHALGQRDFPLQLVGYHNLKNRERRKELMRDIFIVVTIAWLTFAVWFSL